MGNQNIINEEKGNDVLPLVIGSSTKHDRHYFKCDVCGKFIGYVEFERDEIKTDYRPETVYECEKITHIHKHCL
jgi:hypothetical protein